MQQGKVKFFNHSKGFGFITPDDGKDLFVHISNVRHGAELQDGDKVEFSIEEGKRGPQAVEVTVIH